MNNNKIPCICGHLEYVHVKYASAQYPVLCPTKCDACILIGKALAGVFHEYHGDNLRYLEYKSEQNEQR
jgi:hypothetical protein